MASYYCDSMSNISGLMQETLHTHNENKKSREDSYDALEAANGGSNAKEKEQEIEGSEPTSNESLFMNWPLMSSIIVYCVFSLHDMAYTEVCLKPNSQFLEYVLILHLLSRNLLH